MTMQPRQSKSEEVVMAGDGGRVPDVSEQRAEVEAVARELERTHGDPDTNDGVWRHGTWKRRTQNLEVVANVIAALDAVRASDPASVLAALLAESPEATVAAIEALLTSEKTVEAAARAEYERGIAEAWTAGPEWLPAFDDVPDDRKAAHALGCYGDASWNYKRNARSNARRWAGFLSAACRSLLSEAPKEDG